MMNQSAGSAPFFAVTTAPVLVITSASVTPDANSTAWTLTTTSDVRPVTLGIYQYLGAYVSNWSSVMAAAVLASVPAVVLLVVAQRFVAAGLSDGAVR